MNPLESSWSQPVRSHARLLLASACGLAALALSACGGGSSGLEMPPGGGGAGGAAAGGGGSPSGGGATGMFTFGKPEVLASGLAFPSRIALSDGYLYFAARGSFASGSQVGSVGRVSIDGG